MCRSTGYTQLSLTPGAPHLEPTPGAPHPEPHTRSPRRRGWETGVDDDENKTVWATWAVGVLSGVRDVETYNRGRPS
jgi:hypothetical protein